MWKYKNYQFRNEAGDTTTDPAGILKIIWKYYEQLCPYNFDDVFEMDHYLENHRLLLPNMK